MLFWIFLYEYCSITGITDYTYHFLYKKNFTAIDNYGARTTTPRTLLLPKLYCSVVR